MGNWGREVGEVREMSEGEIGEISKVPRGKILVLNFLLNWKKKICLR